MNRLIIRILIVILIVLVGAAALSHLNPSADKSKSLLMEGLANIRSWFQSDTSQPSTTADENNAEKTDPNSIRVYKWQDASGTWQFSNEPPPEGVARSVKIYRTDANITQSTKPEPPPAEETADTADIPTTAAPLMPITDPERVKKLMEDAKNVQNLLDQHQQSIDKAADAR